jgi:hypothetical protein
VNCRTLFFGPWVFAFALSIGAVTSSAQDEPPWPDDPPKPAGYAFPVLTQPEGELQPDFSPLTGMPNVRLGFPEVRHSYWVPGLQFCSNAFSNPYTSYNQTGNSHWTNDTYIIGNLSLVKARRLSMLAINYSGGGYISTDSRQGSGYYQQLALAQNIQTKRWLIQLIDQFSANPQSSFGYGGVTNLGVPGVGGSLGTIIPGLGGNYVPSVGIYGVGAFHYNLVGLQATYALSHRASVTVAGSYGLLDFQEAGNINSRTTVGSIGYNYALSRNDTIGLVYRFSSYQFPGDPQAYGSQVVSFAYGRKVTRRLGLRLFVGPEITNYRIPVGSSSQNVGFSTTANMTYAFHQGRFTLGYIHGLYANSGVLVGSNLDEATAYFSRNLTRAWTASVHSGYSRNSPVGGTTVTGYPVYDSWYVGGGVSRPMGENLNFGLSYTANITSYHGPNCTEPNCNSPTTYHTITASFQWHPRPFLLE